MFRRGLCCLQLGPGDVVLAWMVLKPVLKKLQQE